MKYFSIFYKFKINLFEVVWCSRSFQISRPVNVINLQSFLITTPLSNRSQTSLSVMEGSDNVNSSKTTKSQQGESEIEFGTKLEHSKNILFVQAIAVESNLRIKQ